MFQHLHGGWRDDKRNTANAPKGTCTIAAIIPQVRIPYGFTVIVVCFVKVPTRADKTTSVAD